MIDNVDIVVNPTIESVNITQSVTSEVIDIDVSAVKTSVEITATPYLTIVNINEISVVNTEQGTVIPTNLYYDAYPEYGIVNSNTGTDAIIPLADGVNAGLINSTEKTKLSNTSGVNTGDQNLQTVTNGFGNGTTINPIIVNTTTTKAITGNSIDENGVTGTSTNNKGISGNSTNSYGIAGISTNNSGILGQSTNSTAAIFNTISGSNIVDFKTNNVSKASINNLGELTAVKIKKQGGTGLNILLDDGNTALLSSVSGVTNLSPSQNPTSFTIVSDTGTDATIPLGNGNNAGASLNDYTTTEKNKLAAISGSNTGDQNLQTVTNGAGNGTTTNPIIVNKSTANAITGNSNTADGITGTSTDGKGVIGTSIDGNGIFGDSTNSTAAIFNTIDGADIVDFQQNYVSKASINSVGDINANSFKKINGTGSEILMADGNVIIAGDYINITNGKISSVGSGGGGGSGVSYYLNGSIPSDITNYNQITTSAVIGVGTNFTLTGNGIISQWITDLGSPNRLEIQSGAWNFEAFFQMSSVGGNAKFYVELLKYDGTDFTSISNSSSNPEQITGGTAVDLYLTSLAIPTTTLLATDRLVIRFYIVDNSGGRTVTMHTEDSNLCQIITNFSSGISSLNGLNSPTQNFVEGTGYNDFKISSSGNTHTFHLPSASDTARGVITTGNQTIAGNKTFTGTTAGINKTMVGLNNVDNTTDLLKPISTATQTALDLTEKLGNKQNSLATDSGNTKYPTVTAVNTGLDLTEKLGNKQNSLTTDGTNTKYPTVTAVNTGLAAKENSLPTPSTSGYILSSTTSNVRSWVAPPTGITNLNYTPSTTTGSVTSSTGSPATIPLADATNSGLLSPAEKASIASITSVNTDGVDRVSVKTSASMNRGLAVYISSVDATNNIIVSKATNASNPTTFKVLGINETTVIGSTNTTVVKSGIITGFSTTGSVLGDPVWLGVDGALLYGVANKPITTNNIVYIGVVKKVSGSDGHIFVNIKNSIDLNDVNDVLIGTKANEDFLQYESATSLWKNIQITTAWIKSKLGITTLSGSNTGDDATNVQYSGLAASKQNTLVSTTNIKSINGDSVLGSGNLTVSANQSLQSVVDISGVVTKNFNQVDTNTIDIRNTTVNALGNPIGTAIYARGANGIIAESTNGDAIFGVHSGTIGNAIRGESDSGTAISGSSDSGSGFLGQSASGIGLQGISFSGTAIDGYSYSGYAIKSESALSSGIYAKSNDGYGIESFSNNGYGLYSSGYKAAKFYGDNGGMECDTGTGTGLTVSIGQNASLGVKINVSSLNVTAPVFVVNNSVDDIFRIENSGYLKVNSAFINGTVFKQQSSPASFGTATTLTPANLLTNIIRGVSGTSSISWNLPTGASMESAIPNAIANQSFDWSIVNTGGNGGAVILVASSGHTIVGNLTVAIQTSASYRTVKSTTNTFITYRIS